MQLPMSDGRGGGGGGSSIHKRWTESLLASREVTANKASPFVNKCLLRAKVERGNKFRKLREDPQVDYTTWAAEIMNELRHEASFSTDEEMYFEDEKSLLQELSEALRAEYDDFMAYLSREDEAEEIDTLTSLIEMSEISDEQLLLCPFCRKSAMALQAHIDGTVEYRCGDLSCCKSLLLSRDSKALGVCQLREMFAAIFGRHKLACEEISGGVNAGTVDSSLCFEQSHHDLLVYCTRCGFSDVMML